MPALSVFALPPSAQGLIEFIIEDTGLTGRAQESCQLSAPVPFVISPGGPARKAPLGAPLSNPSRHPTASLPVWRFCIPEQLPS